MPVASTVPLAVGTPKAGCVVISSANTNRDGTTGAYTTLYTAGTSGAIVNRVKVVHMGAITVASTAMVARLWRTVSVPGAATVLEDEVALTAVTPTSAVVGATATFSKTNIVLAPGEILKGTISIGEAVGFIVDQGGDY